jgi:hypothetical protein
MDNSTKELLIQKFARLRPGFTGEPEGLDGLFLDSIHFRSFIYSLNAIQKESFENSYLCKLLVVGATYTITFLITKLYDRQKDYKINSLRENFKKIGFKGAEADLIVNEFYTKNDNSLFKPLLDFRDNTLAHNGSVKEITWGQVDKALIFYSRVWYIANKAMKSGVLFPFYDFNQVSTELNLIFNQEQLQIFENAWNEYILNINKAMKIILV